MIVDDNLTKAQREALEALRNSRHGTLDVGTGMLFRRTADALVRKGYCEYGTISGWGDQPSQEVIRLKRD